MSPVRTIRTHGPVSKPERADAARNRTAILEAADALFAQAESPETVSMDDIATAAGVGKGTLFRRFGDRPALVRAVFDARGERLREAISSGPPPLGPGSDPRVRIAAILDAVLLIKVENRHLSLAVEGGLLRGSLFDAPSYQRLHGVLAGELKYIVNGGNADWTAHALLSTVRADLIHRMFDDGMSVRQLRKRVGAFVQRLLR